MSRGDWQMRIRLPQDVREWLETEAAQQCRSLNGQVLYSLERERERSTEKREKPAEA